MLVSPLGPTVENYNMGMPFKSDQVCGKKSGHVKSKYVQFVYSKKKQEAHGPHRSPELTAVNMYM